MPEQQSQQFARQLSKLLEWLAIVTALAVFLSVVMGVSGIAHGLWSLVWRGHYAGQEFRLAVNLPELLQHKVFKWDKAWWFTLILPIFGCQIVEAFGNCSAWLVLTPAERQERRDKTRSEAETKGIQARDALRAQKEQARADQSKRAYPKNNEHTMSGWRRLWIVLSILFGLLAFFIAYSDASRAYVWVEPSSYVKAQQGQAFTDAFFVEASRSHAELNACVLATTKVSADTISCERDPFNVFFAALPWALLPGLLMMIVSLTVRWIYRGFRTTKALPVATSGTQT